MSVLARPHGFGDGLGGAIALVADRLAAADLECLRGCFAVVERFEPVHDHDGYVAGWLPTRWPLECDAALATFAARALASSDPALRAVLDRVRVGCEDDELRSLAGIVDAGAPSEELERQIVRIASRPSSVASRALAQAHRLLPLTSYDVHRSLPSVSASMAATLILLALESGSITPRQLVETVRAWAPTGAHAGRTTAPRVLTATWPGFAVLLAGPSDPTLPVRLAEGFATAPSLDAAHARFESLTEGLEGAGLVALLGDEAVIFRGGFVHAWWTDGARVTRVLGPRTHDTHHTLSSVTWGLHVGELPDAALRTAAEPPLERVLARLVPSRSKGLAELFSPTTEREPPPDAAAVLLRAPHSPRPSISADPNELASRRARVETLVERELRGTSGLEASVDVAGHDGTNAAMEQVGVLRVTVIRDDASGSSSELDAARAIELALAARPDLSPCEVVGEYVK